MKRRTLYLLIPFFSLAALLLLLNLLPRLLQPSPPPAPTPALAGEAVATAVPQPAASPIATAIRNSDSEPDGAGPPPSAAMTPTPLILPDAGLKIYGPPPDGRFFAGEWVNFYWDWPLSLGEDLVFELVLEGENDSLVIGRLTEPNLGPTGFRLAAQISLPGRYHWQIQLVDINQVEPIFTGERRPLTIEPNP